MGVSSFVPASLRLEPVAVGLALAEQKKKSLAFSSQNIRTVLPQVHIYASLL